MSRNKLLATVAATCLAGTIASATPASAVVINDLFVFGDSYSDTGAFFPLTNGSTAVGYLAKNFDITLTTSKNADPGTDGVNFAESGARVFVGPTPPNTQPRSLTQQVDEFKNYVDKGDVTFNPDSTLFFLAGGLNDHDKVTSAQINAATTSQVSELYSLGARIFEITLLPQDIPAFTDSALNINPGYEALVPELQKEFPDATFALSNWGPDYDNIIMNPSEFGMTNVTDPCRDFSHPSTPTCSTPDTYFYYFNAHPSDESHHIVGNDLFTEVLGLPAPVPEPSTWAMMFLGFVGLGFASRRGARKRLSVA
jgi:cholinesterase